MKKNISIVTVTQLKKFPTLEILNDILEEQTLSKNIYEWIIVEGSMNKEDGDLNALNIETLKIKSKLNIFYSRWRENMKLGGLRNLSNYLTSPSTEYIFCFDDDDYYFPERLEYTIEEFKNNPDKDIAGCKSLFIYDWYLKKSFLTDETNKFTSNNCMAYRRRYLDNHKYDDLVEVGEEASFLENFENDDLIIQLDNKKIVYMNSHSLNTYNKREILFLGYYNLHKYIKYNDSLDFPPQYFNRYSKIYMTQEIHSFFDIVYICGFIGIKWSPNDLDLGGSEQAVVELTTRFAKFKNVAVYGNIKEDCIYNGVHYYSMSKFDYNMIYKNVILWRDIGLMAYSEFNVKAENVILDLHDNMKLSPFKDIHKRILKNINTIAFKSKYHLTEYLNELNINDKETIEKLLKNMVVIQNGVHDDFFKYSLVEHKKNPLRFCYCSCYSRGLIHILAFIWCKIVEAFPDAELHIYYGRDFCNDDYKKILTELLGNSKNVMDHGRRKREDIIKEKLISQYQLYISDSELEIDCISIKESIKLNCIPLISNFGVFEERNGIHFNEDLKSKESYEKVALSIINLIKNNKTEELLNSIIINDTVKSWDTISNTWLYNIIKH